MIAGHNGNHLGFYKSSIQEAIIKLAYEIELKGLSKDQITVKVLKIIQDTKIGVDKGSIIMNTGEYYILENVGR